MIVRYRPANIRLINRRSKLLRLLLALSSGKDECSDDDKNSPHELGRIDTVTPYQAKGLIEGARTIWIDVLRNRVIANFDALVR